MPDESGDERYDAECRRLVEKLQELAQRKRMSPDRRSQE